MAASAATAYRTHHFQGASSPASESQRPRIAGGTLSITPVVLIAATLAYCRGTISRRIFRVWAALVEVRARRDIAKRRGAAPFPLMIGHVMKALGASAPMNRVDVEHALEDLAALGVVVMTKGRIVFVDDLDGILDRELRHEVVDTIERFEIGQKLDRGMILPRRMVSQWRRQARGSRVATAVLVGLLLRVMMHDDEYPDYRGCVKIRWLEMFSGGTRSGVKRALRAVERAGVFERLWAKQGVLDRYGQWYRLNPNVPVQGDQAKSPAPDPSRGQTDEVRSPVCGKVSENDPPHCQKVGENNPPCINQVSPSGRYKNQVHAYARLKSGAYQRFSSPSRPVVWWYIDPAHLSNPGSLLTLYQEAINRRHLQDRPGVLREVFIQAQRILRRYCKGAIPNPGAVMRSTLENWGRPRLGSGEDEDRASQLLARLDEGLARPAAEAMAGIGAAVVADNEVDEPDFDAGDTGFSGGQRTASDEDGGVGNGAVYPWEMDADRRRAYLERNVNAVTETLLLGDRCWHDESSPRPLQGAPIELVAVVDVDRESEGIFCPACESWRVGRIWYVKDERETGVWHARSGEPDKGSV